MQTVERLLIVSHTPHYQRDGRVVGWGPTVREIDYLAELFGEVVHVAVGYDGPAPDSAQPYHNERVRLRLVPPSGGEGVADKIGILGKYPGYARVIGQEMATAEALHVRCPANISLLTQAMLRRRVQPAYRWLKYAGNWQPEQRGALSNALERRWLAGGAHGGMVTVNGRWPDQPSHVVTFSNPSLTEEEMRQGKIAAAGKRMDAPVELLFAGRLDDAKGVGRVLEVCRLLTQLGVDYRLRLLGDGPDRPRYEAWVKEEGLSNIEFCGWVPRNDIVDFYATAHIILLPSVSSEGWPKVLSEAMSFGVVVVASAISSIPQILGETGAGVAIDAHDVAGQAAAVSHYVHDPQAWQEASNAGVAVAERFSYRAYQQAVVDLFEQSWNVRPSRASILDDSDGERRPAVSSVAAFQDYGR